MNGIINISSSLIEGKAVQTVSARDLHTYLGVQKDFSDWIKQQVVRANLLENKDFIKISLKGELSATGQTKIEYFLAIESAKHVAMVSGTSKGRDVRDYFIECERKLYQQIPFNLPNFNDPVSSARAWADATENAQKQEAIARALAQQIETDKPDTYIGRALRGDESKTYGLRDWISLIKKDHENIKERVVIKWLLDNKYIYRKGDNTLAAYSVYAKYFSLHESVINDVMRKRLKITAKGVMTLTPLIIDHFSHAEL